MTLFCRAGLLSVVLLFLTADTVTAVTYPVVDTGQNACYNNREKITCPQQGEQFYGQDGQHQGNPPSYRDNQDGTVSDLNTGLMWAKERGNKMTWDEAMRGADEYRVGGYSDWRVPTIKELYSLINFNGGFHPEGDSRPYLDTRFFAFSYGDPYKGEREIDCQDWSATRYVGTTMDGNATIFGVNFADGRIKGYPLRDPRRGDKLLYVRYVRDNPEYGINDFYDNGDGTITDHATGLMWSKADSNKGMDWQAALAWVQEKNTAHYLGHSDWRLPNAKELQSLVNYEKAPQATNFSRRGPAIDSLFFISQLADGDYPFFWTGTSHLDGPKHLQCSAAVYIAFGCATGWMSERPTKQGRLRTMDERRRQGPHQGPPMSRMRHNTSDSRTHKLVDVHGAGAQRSDPKEGNPGLYPKGRGPQGDVIRIYNYVRLVRDAVHLQSSAVP